MSAEECFISVDIEASGPVPGLFSMLSLGACVCEDHLMTFETILRPTTMRFVPEALEVTGFDLHQLQRDGREPAEAMREFRQWALGSAGSRTPVFVGLNAAFDWAFVNYYFHIFEIPNPFGIAPLDIKALYMGRFRTQWRDATSKRIAGALGVKSAGDHTALTDALAQADLFHAVRNA
jgi:DNA polymerase III epsilon subunit-like protein